MTAPMWMAAPPEVHSALLSSGPGPGALLASADAWTALSSEYNSVATELTALLSAVHGGSWDGPSAEAYVAAHVPYLEWLAQASANSAAIAAEQETAATAYAAALAAMPTLAELAANHATHAVLLATNFFGINTIPIAVNEADYFRMWIQAATTMGTYQAVSDSAVAEAPTTTPAPQIMKANAASTAPPSTPTVPQWYYQLDQLVSQLIPQDVYHALVSPGNLAAHGNPPTLFEFIFPPDQEFLPPLPPGTNPYSVIFNTVSSLAQEAPPFFVSAYLNTAQTPAQFLFAFPLFFTTLFTHEIGTIGQVATLFATQPAYLLPLAPIVAAPLPVAPLAGLPALGALGGAAGLAGVAAVPTIPAAVDPTAVGLAPLLSPSVAASTAAAPGSALTSVPAAPTPAPGVAPAAGVPPAPPPAGAVPPPSITGAENFGYLVGGFPAADKLRSSSRAKAQTPAPDKAAVPSVTATATREKPRARRRQRVTVKQLGRGYEYMDLDDSLGPDEGATGDQHVTSTAASDQGAGTLGSAGTTRSTAAAEPAGLTSLAGDSFGESPTMPMLPGTWGSDPRARTDPGDGDTTPENV